MTTIINVVFLVGMVALILSFIHNVVDIFVSMTDSAISKSRLKQFKKGTKREEISTKEQISSLTEFFRYNVFPKINKYLPSLKVESLEQRERDLKFIGWDDTFTPETFVATSIILKIVGVALFLLLPLLYPLLGLYALLVVGAGGFCCIFLLDMMYNSEQKTKNENLFADFPDFVRIVSGYLTANMPLVKAIEESIKYVSDDWKHILGQFIVDCESKGTSVALEGLRDSVNIFEVREFVALVRLTLEQGGEAKESFAAQAEKVAEMQKDQFILKIGKRKMYATVCQGPSLLLTMVVLMVPTLMSVAGQLF